MQYFKPRDLHDAIRLRSDTGCKFLAGGTDIYPSLENGIKPIGLIDISGLRELSGAVQSDGCRWIIPAMTTWSALASAILPRQFDGAKEAAAKIGGRQIQNRATIGGNICNASPAADGLTALMSLEAWVTLVGRAGSREMPLESFVLGNRQTALEADEILLNITVPVAQRPHSSIFKKLGTRRYLVISVAMVGLFMELDNDHRLSRVAICVGSCGPRPVRLKAAEERLLGMRVDQAAKFSLISREMRPLSPISDIRATASYRLAAAQTLVEEAIRDVAGSLIDE